MSAAYLGSGLLGLRNLGVGSSLQSFLADASGVGLSNVLTHASVILWPPRNRLLLSEGNHGVAVQCSFYPDGPK